MQHRSCKNGVCNVHFKLFYIKNVIFLCKKLLCVVFFCTFATGKPIEVSVYITFRLKSK